MIGFWKQLSVGERAGAAVIVCAVLFVCVGVPLIVTAELGARVPTPGQVVTTWVITGGLGSGEGRTLVDLDDGRRVTVRGIRGIRGDRIVVSIKPRKELP